VTGAERILAVLPEAGERAITTLGVLRRMGVENPDWVEEVSTRLALVELRWQGFLDHEQAAKYHWRKAFDEENR